MTEGSLQWFLRDYKKLGLNDPEALLLVHLLLACQAGLSPDRNYLRQVMTVSDQELDRTLERFSGRDWLRLASGSEGKYDCSRLLQLFEQWARCRPQETSKTAAKSAAVPPAAVVEIDMVEAEVAVEAAMRKRLTPLQRSEVQRLVQQHGRSLLMEALRQAELNDRVTLRIVGNLLAKWQRQGINSALDLERMAELSKQSGATRKSRRNPGAQNDSEQYDQIMSLLMSPAD